MPVESPDQYELKVLTFYQKHLEGDFERPHLKRNYAAVYLGVAFISLAADVLLYNKLEAVWLCTISAVGSMALLGAIMLAQSRAHFKLLRPYINVDQLRARIDQLSA